MTEDEFLDLFNKSYDRYMSNMMRSEPIKVKVDHNWIESAIAFISGIVCGAIIGAHL